MRAKIIQYWVDNHILHWELLHKKNTTLSRTPTDEKITFVAVIYDDHILPIIGMEF